MRSKAVARRLHSGAEDDGAPAANNDDRTAGDSQESGSPPPSPTDSATSESAPTLVHIKQETMPPGVDIKDYYSTLDYGLSDTYLSPNFSEYGRGYLPGNLELPNHRYDSKSPTEKDKGGKDDDILDSDLNLPIELVLKNGGVFARVNIPSGTKYGPFQGKWETRPLDTRYAWEVKCQQTKTNESAKRRTEKVAIWNLGRGRGQFRKQCFPGADTKTCPGNVHHETR